ncbi:hypothetical protein ACFLUZ_05010 [Chloroflexota bacterium]
MTKMRKVCAWCGKDMGEIEGHGKTGTTHGICEECKKKELTKVREYHARHTEVKIQGDVMLSTTNSINHTEVEDNEPLSAC